MKEVSEVEVTTAIDKEQSLKLLEQAGTLILQALNKNINEPGLIETPKRFAKMIMEQCEGEFVTDKDIIRMFDKCFPQDSEDIVTCCNIPVFSHCEHHLALMYDMTVSIGYYPNGKVIGLSKMARIADMVAKRLQLQERIGNQIKNILSNILETKNVIVVVSGKHSCMTARGIKKPEAGTVTVHTSGRFKYIDEQEKFMEIVRLSK